MLNVDLDKACPKTRHTMMRYKCLQTLQRVLDHSWRKTLVLAKAANVKFREMSHILKLLKSAGVVESLRTNYTFWRLKSGLTLTNQGIPYPYDVTNRLRDSKGCFSRVKRSSPDVR